MSKKDEFRAAARTLRRQIENAINDVWWHREITQDVLKAFNKLARSVYQLETDILQLTDSSREVECRVDPQLQIFQDDPEWKSFGYVYREPFRKDVCIGRVAEFTKDKNRVWQLSIQNTNARQYLINAIDNWLDFIDFPSVLTSESDAEDDLEKFHQPAGWDGRPAYHRDHYWLWLKQNKGMTPKPIQEHWNSLGDLEQKKFGFVGKVSRSSVETGIKTAKKEPSG